MLDFDLFRRVVEETGPSLVRIDFFNYGETFLHKRAVEMCEDIKARHPHIYLYTSTNGLAFTDEQAAAPGALGHRRGDVLDRRGDARTRTRGTGSAATSSGRSGTCALMADEKRADGPRRRPFSTGGTSSSPGTTATPR